jgi:hypothetical protein
MQRKADGIKLRKSPSRKSSQFLGRCFVLQSTSFACHLYDTLPNNHASVEGVRKTRPAYAFCNIAYEVKEGHLISENTLY